MLTTWARIGVCAVLGAGGLLIGAAPASADVITPPGACVGTATWLGAGFTETSTNHQPGDVIKVPRTDTVQWVGAEKGFAVGSQGPRRDINGQVTLSLPIGSATIKSWGGSSVRYANTGKEKYDLPSVLGGLKLKLAGFHDDGGTRTCTGSVYVEFAGGGFKNPIAAGALAGLVLSGGLLLWAGKPVFTKISAFEDTNPG